MHETLMIHEDIVHGWCKEFLGNYKQATTYFTQRQLPILVAWTPLGASLFKVNRDAALD